MPAEYSTPIGEHGTHFSDPSPGPDDGPRAPAYDPGPAPEVKAPVVTRVGSYTPKPISYQPRQLPVNGQGFGTGGVNPFAQPFAGQQDPYGLFAALLSGLYGR